MSDNSSGCALYVRESCLYIQYDVCMYVRTYLRRTYLNGETDGRIAMKLSGRTIKRTLWKAMHPKKRTNGPVNAI